MNRAIALRKQALERWRYVPHDEKIKLIEELKSRPPGSAAIELGEPDREYWQSYSAKIKACVVPLAFGMDLKNSEKRYLMLSDIPQ